ncbi:MAG: peroxiredoxin [Chloroflexota bacterium]
MRSSTNYQPPPLPEGLPVPVDDGAAAHLPDRLIPDLKLRSTEGQDVNLAELAATQLVLYIYPKMGRPDDADPPGWNETPGARGCTQQSCAFRDLHYQFRDLGYRVAGVSAQDSEEQEEAAQRLHLSFPLLADPTRQLGEALKLPTLEIAGMILYSRLTLVARARRIVKIFYPVFPPDENAEEVLQWIRSDSSSD